jgi:MFS superfamily sulfate permease-like transporter
MAYATVAGLPPVVGLWAALVPLAVYAVLGSSRQLSVGPESTTALMTATALGPLAAGDPGRYAALAAAVALLVGAICFIGGMIRLGMLADLLSRPVLVGYMTGVAVIMIGSQLGKVTGVSVKGDEFVDQVRSFTAGVDRGALADDRIVGGGAARPAGACAGGAACSRTADCDAACDGRRRRILVGPQRDQGHR